MGIERIRLDHVVEAVDRFLERLAQDSAPAPAQQRGEHPHFPSLQIQARVAHPGFAMGHVEHEITDDDVVRRKLVRTALNRTETGKHFLQVERLHQVVVGAIVQPGHPVGQLAAGAQQ